MGIIMREIKLFYYGLLLFANCFIHLALTKPVVENNPIKVKMLDKDTKDPQIIVNHIRHLIQSVKQNEIKPLPTTIPVVETLKPIKVKGTLNAPPAPVIATTAIQISAPISAPVVASTEPPAQPVQHQPSNPITSFLSNAFGIIYNSQSLFGSLIIGK